MSDGNGVTPPKQPPSLIGGAASSPTAPKAAGGEPRILAGLDGKGAKAVKAAAKSTPVGARGGRKGVWIGIVALLALVVAAGGIWRSQQRTGHDETLIDARSPSEAGTPIVGGPGAAGQVQQNPSAATSSTTVTVQAGAGSTAAPTANTSGPNGTTSGTAQTPPQTATIVDSATQGTNGATTSTSAAIAPRGAPQSDPMQALVAKTEARDAHDKRHAPTVADAKDAKSKHDEKKLTRHERALALREAREQERPKTAAHAKNEDPDADILAALFKHTNATDPAGTAAVGKKGDGTAATTHAAKPVPGSLAARVDACRSKGFFDGEVCRWQVCNGHWGSDPACPGNERAAAATH